jgi:hypothetical protein
MGPVVGNRHARSRIKNQRCDANLLVVHLAIWLKAYRRIFVFGTMLSMTANLCKSPKGAGKTIHCRR